MNRNNRMPQYREKVYEKRRVYHTEVKDGVRIFVEGESPQRLKLKDIPCSSLKLKARIDSDTFENHEGSPRKLEKAQGSDIMTEEIRKAQNDFEKRKQDEHEKNVRKKIREAVAKDFPDVAQLVNE